MLNFIKKLFGFGKEEKVEVKVSEENVEAVALAEAVSNFKEDVKVVEDTTTHVLTVNIGNKSKEELEKIVSDRMAEIENKKEAVKEVVAEVKAEPKKKVTPKPKKEAPKAEPKKEAPKKAPAKKESAPKAPKKETTKKGKK